MKGRIDDARAVLAVVDDMPADSQHVEIVLQQICAVNEHMAEKASFFSLFKMGKEKMRYRLILAAITQLFSQMSGLVYLHRLADNLR